jgi:predicted Zn-dependent protease
MSYSREQVKEITDKALNMIKADAAEVRFEGGQRAATRFANSTITVNLIEHDQEIQITVFYGQKTATTEVHQFDDATLKNAIEQVQAVARRKPDNPETVRPVRPPQNYEQVDALLPSCVNFGPAERAAMVKASIDVCEKKGVLGAGYIPKLHGTEAIANSEGLFGYHQFAEASFILTCRTHDQTGAGWAATTGVKDVSLIDPVALTERAADKAIRSRNPRSIEPGRYTIIMEPRVAGRYVALLLGAFEARAAEEGRSFLSGKERGESKVGQKILGDNFTLRSHIGNPILRQTPVGPDGLAARSMTWVEKGVLKNLFYSRSWAARRGVAPTPTAQDMSLIVEGGEATIEDMIKTTKRGLLATYFWYIRAVDPMRLLYTGMTRNGLFLIENGEIVGPVQNFRWNDSPIAGFNNISMLGRPVPMHIENTYDTPGTALVPPLKIEDFKLTSISPAV